MATSVLQINFKLKVGIEEYEKIANSLGETFAGVEGLEWKIWLLNRAEREAGGLYAFRDDRALDAFLAGPLAAEVKKAPFLDNLSVKRFDVLEDVTRVTRGPIDARAMSGAAS